MPYQQEVGWVPDRDSAWLVVAVDVYAGAVAMSSGSSVPVGDPSSLELTLDGQPPLALALDDVVEGLVVAVFPTRAIGSPTGDLRVAGTWLTTLEDPLVSATWTVPIG